MLFIDDAVCTYAAETYGPTAQAWLTAQIAAALAAAPTPPTLIIVRMNAGSLVIEMQ